MEDFEIDTFQVVGSSEDISRIASIFEGYQADFKEINDPKDKTNYMLMLYYSIGFDEGYRKALDEQIKDSGDLAINIKPISPRSHGSFVYMKEKYMANEYIDILRKRIRSEKQRSSYKKLKGELNETLFHITMAINTGFEQGYCASHSVEGLLNNFDLKDGVAEMTQELLDIYQKQEK